MGNDRLSSISAAVDMAEILSKESNVLYIADEAKHQYISKDGKICMDGDKPLRTNDPHYIQEFKGEDAIKAFKNLKVLCVIDVEGNDRISNANDIDAVVKSVEKDGKNHRALIRIGDEGIKELSNALREIGAIKKCPEEFQNAVKDLEGEYASKENNSNSWVKTVGKVRKFAKEIF